MSVMTILSACENSTKYNGEYDKSQVVLGVKCLSDSTLLVSVSKSVFFLDIDEETTVNNAQIEATINGINEPLVLLSDGLYQGSSILKEKDTIIVNALVPGIGLASAHEIVPKAVDQLFTCSMKPYTGQCDDDYRNDEYFGHLITDSVFCISIKLNKSDDEVAYYRLSFEVKSEYYYKTLFGEGDTTRWLFSDNTHYYIPSTTLKALGKDPAKLEVALEDEEENESNKSFLFSDEYLSDNDIPLEFEFMLESPYLDLETEGDAWEHLDKSVNYRINMKLETMTEGMYHYIKSSNEYSGSGYELFAEPVSIYSNIQNGIGTIMACSVQDTVFQREYVFK